MYILLLITFDMYIYTTRQRQMNKGANVILTHDLAAKSSDSVHLLLLGSLGLDLNTDTEL